MIYQYSRHSYCQIWQQDDGKSFIDRRVPFGYRAFRDNKVHVVKEGESIFTVAGHHFAPHPRAAGLWWVIADFQPNPIHDPTVQLSPGTALIVPSLQNVTVVIFDDEQRRAETRV